MSFLDIWINCPDLQTAHAIANAVIERRLAACANIHAEIASVYHWKGSVERAQEVPLVVKTRPELFEQVAEVAKALHPDETPAIHGIEAKAVTSDYLLWLQEETQADNAADQAALPTGRTRGERAAP